MLEDERIFRVSEASNTSLKNLLTAFINEEHDKIQAFFRSGFDFARATGGALPDETSD